MPTPKKSSTPTLDELLETYTPLCLTPTQWQLIAPDLRFLIRAINPSSCWTGRGLLLTACRFISLLSPDGNATTIAEAFTYEQVARHRALAAASGMTETAQQNGDGALNALLAAHLGLPQRPANKPVGFIEPLSPTDYAAVKSAVQTHGDAEAPLSRAQLKAGSTSLKTIAPGASPRRLRASWVLEVLAMPGSFLEVNAKVRLNRCDLALVWPHLKQAPIDLSRLRDGH